MLVLDVKCETPLATLYLWKTSEVLKCQTGKTNAQKTTCFTILASSWFFNIAQIENSSLCGWERVQQSLFLICLLHQRRHINNAGPHPGIYRIKSTCLKHLLIHVLHLCSTMSQIWNTILKPVPMLSPRRDCCVYGLFITASYWASKSRTPRDANLKNVS